MKDPNELAIYRVKQEAAALRNQLEAGRTRKASQQPDGVTSRRATLTTPWLSTCAGGWMLHWGTVGIGFISQETLEALVKRGEAVPLGPLPEGET